MEEETKEEISRMKKGRREDKRCYTCKYRSAMQKAGSEFWRDYISITGHRRCCEAGDNCDKYEPRRKSRWSRKGEASATSGV